MAGKLTFSGKSLEVDGRTLETRWAVQQAYAIGNKIIVLLDVFSTVDGLPRDIHEMRKSPRERNLQCFCENGQLLWEAEFPEDDGADYYYSVTPSTPLIASSFSSYRCEIDLNTGKVLRREFYK
jgi:hypothetical protein